MNTEKLRELYPELTELAKIGNFIRICALLRHDVGITKIGNILINDLTARELTWGLDKLVLQADLDEYEAVIADDEPLYTKTKLNAMKKADLVALLLGE